MYRISYISDKFRSPQRFDISEFCTFNTLSPSAHHLTTSCAQGFLARELELVQSLSLELLVGKMYDLVHNKLISLRWGKVCLRIGVKIGEFQKSWLWFLFDRIRKFDQCSVEYAAAPQSASSASLGFFSIFSEFLNGNVYFTMVDMLGIGFLYPLK